jgi:hypothetical protein
MQRLKAASAIRLIQQRPPISNRSLFSLASLFRRSPKIGYLPFKALTSEDLKRIGVDWYQGFIPRILQRANAEKAPAQLKDLDYEKTTKLKAVRCYYLPYFVSIISSLGDAKHAELISSSLHLHSNWMQKQPSASKVPAVNQSCPVSDEKLKAGVN